MITDEENKKIEEIAKKYIRKSDCALTEAANIEFRKGLKKRIIELLEVRDQTKPYSPILQKK
jgi:spore coat protein CotF